MKSFPAFSTLIKCLLPILLILLFLPDIQAKEYFVSLKGLDSNEGTVENPFRTIAYASARIKPGDTLTIRGGTYLLDAQFRPQGGETGKWITYRSMPGEKAILDGSEIYRVNDGNEGQYFSRVTQGVVQIEKASWVKFENIGVVNSRAAGFIVRGPSTQIVLDGCTADRTYNSGIGLWYADSVKVFRCEVVRANDLEYRNEEVQRRNEAPHEAISICGARFFEVAYNHVHHCYKEGIDCKEVSCHGIIHHNYVHDIPRQAYYVDAWFGLLEDVELYDNKAHDCAWGFAVSVEGKDSEVRNIRFHHNVIYNMKAAGVLFGLWGDNNLRSDIHIYNNTFYKCGSPRWFSGGVGSIDILSKNFKDVYVYRNICDKGWDYEMGFSFTPQEVKQAIKKLNFNADDNLFESAKNRPSRIGQFDYFVYEYLPPNNTMGSPLYRNELLYDLTPVTVPSVKKVSAKWKYPPSPWYGAIKPEPDNAQRNEREVKWVNPNIQKMEGLSHRILNSKALGQEVGYAVWTPAEYAQQTDKRYPVLYFLHGLGGNETSDAASFSGKVSEAIKEGLLPPVICVLFKFFKTRIITDSPLSAQNAQSRKVEIKKNSSNAFELTVDGKPVFIKGAVGNSGIELVKKYGGNGIRSVYTKERLDEAHSLGLLVLVNLPVAPQRGGFDYDHVEAVKIQHEKIINIVREIKDHPAVMMWSLGNELDHVPQEVYEPNKIYYNMKVWDAVNDLAKAIHEIDPHHPVMTVVGSITNHKITALINQCPDLDLLGVNEYGDLLKIPQWLRNWEWKKPYMITEWGPTGFWQTKRTPWGYHIEETGSEKADKYKERYEGTILADKEMCLGSFVFLWRQHQEYTHTWFGMFDKEWRETEAVDVMRYEWTGEWPQNRAPRVKSMKINGKSAHEFVTLAPGEVANARVEMQDPDKDDVIRYEWELLREQTSFGYGGGGEQKPESMGCSFKATSDGAVSFIAPLEKGHYRLFVAGYDNGNHVSYANIPVYVGEYVKPGVNR